MPGKSRTGTADPRKPILKKGRAGRVSPEVRENEKSRPDSGNQPKRICPYEKKCGGCSMISLPYEETLKIKEARVRRLLEPYVKLSGIAGMDQPFHYRNKVHAAFARVWDGRREKTVFGIYQEGTHKVVPVRNCRIENETASAIIRDIADLLPSFRIRVYDEHNRQGLLRHVLVRTAHATGQVMVVLVLTSPVLPGKKHFIETLVKKHPEITTIVINVNDRQTSMVLGTRDIIAYGKGYIEDVLCGKRFRLSPQSFYQVNSQMTEKLYHDAIEGALLTGKERVVDAYCGIGTIGLIASDHAREVIGAELNPDAVRDAAENAKRNGVSNIRFVHADAGEFLTTLANEHTACDVIFLDPPRSGASDAFLQAAAKAGPSRIVYISCEPETLARDLKKLRKLGYSAVRAQAYDMFPFAKNCETLCLLERR